MTLSFIALAAALTALALFFVLPGLLRSTAVTAGPRQPRLAGTVALALPALAVALYSLLGRPAGIEAPLSSAPAPTPVAAAESPAVGPAQIEAMVQRLSERLRNQPDDEAGWRMLARSYETLRRFGDAARAYQQLERLAPKDAALLTDHAVVLAMSQGERLGGEPERLIDRALALEPANVQALALSGSAAFERADYARAVTQWRRILATAPADGDITRPIEANIRKAEELAARGPGRR
jgi:cytochrome c-type biogenesis protein CcmH